MKSLLKFIMLISLYTLIPNSEIYSQNTSTDWSEWSQLSPYELEVSWKYKQRTDGKYFVEWKIRNNYDEKVCFKYRYFNQDPGRTNIQAHGVSFMWTILDYKPNISVEYCQIDVKSLTIDDHCN